ncbi:MAG: hypothetical protein ACOYJB_00780 [Christensenellaceae bacterium]|jgi:hypothetical protein
MVVLIVSILSSVFGLLTFTTTFGWASIVGFVLGVASWVLARKLYLQDKKNRVAQASMILGIIGTAVGLVAVVAGFIVGGLLGSVTGIFAF